MRTTSSPNSRASNPLSDPNQSALVATDVGIDGAAASAEEAAMHIVDEDALSG